MNVLLITNGFPNKSETFIYEHVKGLVDRDNKVLVLAKHPGDGPEIQSNNLTVLYYGSREQKGKAFFPFVLIAHFFLRPQKTIEALLLAIKTGHSPLLLALNATSVLKNQTFEVINPQFGPLGNIGLLLKRWGHTRGPVVTSFMGSDISSVPRKFPRLYSVLSQEGDGFLPVCSQYIPRLESFGCPQSKIKVYFSAIDSSLFRFREKTPNNQNPHLVAVGRFVEKKGFLYAVEVLAELSKTHPGAHLTLGGDGPDLDLVQARARELGVIERLVCAGWLGRQEVSNLVDSADIYLGTSVSASTGELEGIPNVLKEAMSMGTPVVAFNHAGVPDLIVDGVNGYLVPERDVLAMVNKIRWILESNNRDIAHNARKTIDDFFDTKVQAERIEQIYSEFISATVS